MKQFTLSALTLFACALLACSENQPTGPSSEKLVAMSEQGSEKQVLRAADAVAFGGHWYKVFDEDLSWHDAKKRCEQLGGYLACIESEAEQQFIADLADGQYLYLGGTDEQEEGEWVWINGSPWKYTSWMGGQPNNYSDNEHYLATYDDGDWVDVAAEGEGFWMPTGFLCEWEK